MSLSYILTMACPDQAGIVAKTTICLAENGAFITETAHFADVDSGRFFGRVEFTLPDLPSQERLQKAFGDLAEQLEMEWALHSGAEKCPVMIMVSKADHCLFDLLYRWQKGELNIDITAIGSNHPDLAPIAERHGLPFHHLPITADTKPAQEAQILDLMDTTGAELLVLARYMQILTAEMCDALRARAINIHHSFLPGFKGARPYHQAFDRGVKLIGATAHFVTSDLDEGPIIEQSVDRIDHKAQPADMIAVGRDIESLVLARAVKYFAERRVFLNGQKTVVFK